MASEENLKELAATLAKLDGIDVDKLLRPRLGDESLEKAFESELAEIRRLAAFAGEHAKRVHNEYVNQARSNLENIWNLLHQQSSRNAADYINQRQQFLDSVRQQLEEARRWQPAFAGMAVLDRGFLEDEGIRREYERVVEDLRRETSDTLAKVRTEADAAVQGAKDLADQIEQRARLTAAKISIKDAQTQFSQATEEMEGRVRFWGGFTIVSLAVLIALPLFYMVWGPPAPPSNVLPGDQWPYVLYHTVLRIFVLSAAGAAATFCVRMFRAHVHMVEKNRHRVRVANSVESFVNSAIEPGQRDLILARLTDAIVDFGDSGLIRGEKDDTGSSVLSSDLLARILGAITAPKRG